MAHSRVHRSTPRDESVRGIIRGGVGGRILPAVRRVGTASELPHLYPIGIVPAAGSATRLQPLEGSKELIRVHGRPVIDFLLDRMKRAGCEEIRVVTRPEKEDVAAHAFGRGAHVVLGRPASVAESLLLGLQGVEPDRFVAIGFPDTIWEPDDGLALVMRALGPGIEAVLGLFSTPALQRSDVVVLDEEGFVQRVEVKPPQPPSRLIWGCMVARAAALAGLETVSEPGALLDRLAHAGVVKGVYLSDRWLDIGTREGLALARAEAVPAS